MGWDEIRRFLAKANIWTGKQTFSDIAVTGGTISGVTFAENFTTSADPAENAAVTTAIVDSYDGVVVTLSAAGNTQTLQNPTTAATIRKFMVINDDDSTYDLPVVANSVTFTLTPGEGQCFIWDGSAWGPTNLSTTLGTLEVKNSPIDDDKVIYRDSETADVLVTSTWTQVKEFLKTYFDTVYAAVLGVDDNYVTDAEKIVIGNTSGINTGDQILPDSVDDLGPSQTDNAGKFLKTDGTNALWDVPAGGGDVVGPATNSADYVPQWNGADSKTLKNGFAVGIGANNLVQLDANAKLPAVDGSQLTDLPGGGGGGDFLVVQVFS
jgi:hypothetical protein